MFGFLLGIVLGAVGGAAYGSRYFRDTDVQTQFSDTQDRLTNLMSEVRSVLDETRVELRQAWGQVSESATEKAQRLQQAAAPGEETGTAPPRPGVASGLDASGSGRPPGLGDAGHDSASRVAR